MAVGDTLLKITEYPFTYSVAFVVISIAGYGLSEPASWAIFSLAGFIATFMAVVDPFGKGVRLYFMQFAEMRFKKPHENQIVNEWTYFRNSFYTKSIDLEKDKIVSNIYFQISILIFSISLSLSKTFANHLVLKIHDVIYCNLECVQHDVTLGLFLMFVIVLGFMLWNGINMSRKAEIVATYLFCINSSKATKESIENLSKCIDNGDWKTAEFWQDKIRDDVKYSRGEKEIILKSIEKIYRPLSRESIQITSALNQFASIGRYDQIGTEAWDTIRNNADFVVMDKDIRQNVIMFYDKIYEYNHWLGTIRRKIDEIILKKASKEYNKEIVRIEYFRRSSSGQPDPNLIESALLDIHPLQYQGTGTPSHIIITHVRRDNGHQEREEHATEKDFQDFDHFWELILEEVNRDTTVIRIKNLFKEIQSENIILGESYLLKISQEANL